MMVPLVMEQGSQLLGEAGRLREQLAATEFFHWAGQLDWHGVFTAGYEAAMSATRSAVDRLSFFGVSFLGAYFIALDMEAFGRILKKRLPSYQHLSLIHILIKPSCACSLTSDCKKIVARCGSRPHARYSATASFRFFFSSLGS